MAWPIHGGNNPGKPSSHGCIHVPLDFARKLYGITKTGDTVLLSDLNEAPGDTVNRPFAQLHVA